MDHPAHFREGTDGSLEIQTVSEHSRNAAEISSARLHCVHLVKTGYIASLLHDCGKCRAAYEAYLRKIMAGLPVQRGSVIHAHAAARFFLAQFHTAGIFDSYRDMTAELLAFATGAHHGLFDCVDEHHCLGFARRLQWDDSAYQEAASAFLEQCAGMEELEALFDQAERELTPVFDRINARDSNENIEKQLEKITQKNERNIMARIKSLKFSRVTRLCSAIVFLAVSIFYLALLSGRHNEVDIPLFRVALLGIFVIAFLLGMSFLFPKDFKYVYYYNGILFSVSLILSCQNANVTPFFGIIATAVIFLSFLLTMIVDGRTWMGAKPD